MIEIEEARAAIDLLIESAAQELFASKPEERAPFREAFIGKFLGQLDAKDALNFNLDAASVGERLDARVAELDAAFAGNPGVGNA